MTTVQAADNFTPPQIWRRIFWIQTFTIVWMTAEAGVALASAWRARSPALLGFGGVNLIELLSAALVFLGFREERVEGHPEKRSWQIARILLIAMVGFVVIDSAVAFI